MAYEYFTREQWGARPARRVRPRNTRIDEHVVHHTAGRNLPTYANAVESTKRPGIRWLLSFKRGTANRRIRAAVEAYNRGHANLVEYEMRAMRAIQNYHMDVNRWDDVGYHDVCFPSGHVYQGRRFDATGAHALNGNHLYGFSFAGNYELETPTANAVNAYVRRLTALDLSLRKGKGHYRVPGNSTACPGKNLKRTLNV